MFRGHLDQASRHCIRGWALDEGAPDGLAHVRVHVDGELVARLAANQTRDDLMPTLGSTRHGFELFLPGLSALRRHVVSARVEGDARDLPNSPLVIEAADTFDAEVEASLARLVASADLPTLDRAALGLSELIDTILDRRAAVMSGRDVRDLQYRWFAHRGASAEAPPPDAARRALVVAPTDAQASQGFDGFLLATRAVSLRRLGFEVTVLAADLTPLAAPQQAFLASHDIELPRRPFTASAEEHLRRQRNSLDAVLLVGRETARRYLALVESLCPSSRIAYAATMHDLACLDMAAAVGGNAPVEDPLAFKRYPTILPDPQTGTRDPRNIVVSWGEAARPNRASLRRRTGIVMLDDASRLAPILVEHLAAALAIVRATVPKLRIHWRHAPPPGVETDTCSHDAMTVADLAEQVRAAVTIAATPAAYRDVAACFGAGLPCVAPAQVLRDLGLPDGLIAPDTTKAETLAAAILRLHEDAAHNTNVRKRCLDEIDMRHAPEDVDAALRRALRAARGARRREAAAQIDGLRAAVC